MTAGLSISLNENEWAFIDRMAGRWNLSRGRAIKRIMESYRRILSLVDLYRQGAISAEALAAVLSQELADDAN